MRPNQIIPLNLTSRCTIFLLFFALSACSTMLEGEMPFASTEETADQVNPASAYCKEQGYHLEIRSDQAGGQYGVCIFPDGSECEEWSFYRGECAPPPEAGQQQGMAGGLPVMAWAGHVASTPPGMQFDDYIILRPEGAGEIGLAGENETIEAEIVALRDGTGEKESPLFWGTVACEVQDFGGCQLLVSQVRYGQFLMEPQPVENWTGQIRCSHYDSAPDAPCGNAFVLSGRFPVWFGVWSQDPQILEQINNLRDTGTTVTLSGQLLAGVPDVNGTQIQVEKLEISEP